MTNSGRRSLLFVGGCRPAQADQLRRILSRLDLALELCGDLHPAPKFHIPPIVIVQGSVSLKEAQKAYPESPILACQEQIRPGELAGALRAGLFDYLHSQAPDEDWIQALRAALGHFAPAAPANSRLGTERLVGGAPAIETLRTSILHAAGSDSTVLITGETGTGKELIAELIHENSDRAAQPLVCLNCAALPETLIESELFGHERGAFTGAYATYEGKIRQASGGTLFLDEVGELPLSSQAKLLRVLDGGKVYRLGGRQALAHNTRIVAATNRELESQIAAGSFRSDLFFRLNVVRIETPPLRAHPEDIPHLVAALVAEFNRRFRMRASGFGAASLRLLISYHWPGNVRELRNWIESSFVHAPSRLADRLELPAGILAYIEKLDSVPASERDRLVQALVASGWNRTRAAESLRWSRMTVHRKMRQYGIVTDQNQQALA